MVRAHRRTLSEPLNWKLVLYYLYYASPDLGFTKEMTSLGPCPNPHRVHPDVVDVSTLGDVESDSHFGEGTGLTPTVTHTPTVTPH